MWNKLSMADRAKYIKLGVLNGVTDLNNIINAYNTYARGGQVNKYDGYSLSTQLIPDSLKDNELLTESMRDYIRRHYAYGNIPQDTVPVQALQYMTPVNSVNSNDVHYTENNKGNMESVKEAYQKKPSRVYADHNNNLWDEAGNRVRNFKLPYTIDNNGDFVMGPYPDLYVNASLPFSIKNAGIKALNNVVDTIDNSTLFGRLRVENVAKADQRLFFNVAPKKIASGLSAAGNVVRKIPTLPTLAIGLSMLIPDLLFDAGDMTHSLILGKWEQAGKESISLGLDILGIPDKVPFANIVLTLPSIPKEGKVSSPSSSFTIPGSYINSALLTLGLVDDLLRTTGRSITSIENPDDYSWEIPMGNNTAPVTESEDYLPFLSTKEDLEKEKLRDIKEPNKYAFGGNEVNYYDPITGKSYGSIMPEGKVPVTSFDDLTEAAKDEYMQNRATDLDEVTIYPRTGVGAKSTNLGSYYDSMENLTEANMQHAARVAAGDALVRETAAFEKPLNFLSPGQWYGAAVDYVQGESPFWEGIYNGNSGWVTDNFARENPRAAALLNMAGDAAFGYVGDLTYSNLKLTGARNAYVQELMSRAPSLTTDLAYRIAQRRMPYTHERINPLLSNTTWGRKFRYNTGKLFFKDAELPTVYRKAPVADISEGKVQLGNPEVRWELNGDPYKITNTTTDVPVRPHKSAKTGWLADNVYAFPMEELLDYDVLSTRPSDTFLEGELKTSADRTTLYTGKSDIAESFSREGLALLSKEAENALLNVQLPMKNLSLTKPDYKPYAKALLDAVTSQYGRPIKGNYQFVDYVFRPVFESNVFDRGMFSSEIEAAKTLYPDMETTGIDSFRLNHFLEDWDNSNIMYDPSTPAESIYREALGIKEASKQYALGGGFKKYFKKY